MCDSVTMFFIGAMEKSQPSKDYLMIIQFLKNDAKLSMLLVFIIHSMYVLRMFTPLHQHNNLFLQKCMLRLIEVKPLAHSVPSS